MARLFLNLAVAVVILVAVVAVLLFLFFSGLAPLGLISLFVEDLRESAPPCALGLAVIDGAALMILLGVLAGSAVRRFVRSKRRAIN